jgi:cell division inhibitor SepF
MSAMRRIGEYLGLVEDTGRYDEAESYEYGSEYDQYRGYDDEYAHDGHTRVAPVEAAQPVPIRRGKRHAQVTDINEHRHDQRGQGRSAAPVLELSRIVTLHPTTYNDARAVGENYRGGTPVIMNLTEMADADAKRIVDFAAGMIFATHGNIERVTNKVFLLSPANVSVTAEDKRRIVEGGFFNQS